MRLLHIVIAVVLFATACQRQREPRRTMDGAQAADEIAGAFSQNTGVTLDAVDCPAKIPVTVGGTFECTARVQDVSFPIEVTHRTLEGNIDWTTRPIVIPTPSIHVVAQNVLQDHAPGAQGLDCNAPLFLSTPGKVYRCDIPGHPDRWLEVHIDDEHGNFRLVPMGGGDGVEDAQ